MSGALQRCLEECLKLITLSVIGNRFAVVAVEIRPPPARTKIGALACYAWAIDRSECHVVHGVLWKNSVSSEKKMEKVERQRKKERDLYDVEVIEVDTTRKQLKIHFVGFSHEYDEWRDYDNERNYFPFVRSEKNVFPHGRPAGG